jgi:MSHA biogenesis protein MshM
MYLAHFGLREFPFSLTPDIVFAYQAKTHQEGLNTLLLALQGGEGFIKVTGEVGTGKTLLCRTLLDRLGGPDSGTVTAYIPNPSLHSHQMLRHLALELGVRARQMREEPDLYDAVERKLLALADLGKRVVLCIDEAQALPVETLESLRLLSNLETGKHKLIQIVLFGQPELNEMLERQSLRSLASRIAFSARLAPLPLGDLSSYLRHRLIVAGWAGPDLFSAAANRLLWLGSGGVPRRANAMAHKALMLAFGEGHRQVDAGLAWRAWRDAESLPRALRSMVGSTLSLLAGAWFGRAPMGATS